MGCSGTVLPFAEVNSRGEALFAAGFVGYWVENRPLATSLAANSQLHG
jgi:hypothetical protein